jgi:aldehyde:ferredoxin oxidoreductase
MGPYMGKIAWVDLTKGDVSIVDTEPFAQRFLGGRGINSWLLLQHIKVGTRPFDPDNVIVFGAGALVGTSAPASCEISIGSLNVTTGGINYSHAGGYFAPEMKRAGFDHIAIIGKADHPVYLFLHDGIVELRDADGLWGKDIWETQQIIKEALGFDDLRFAAIGPAGENLVKFGIVIIDRTRAAGSGGLGAIMGSKNLKAIAVRGSSSISVKNKQTFSDLSTEAYTRIYNSQLAQMFREKGTHGSYSQSMNESCCLPTRNTEDDHWDPNSMARADHPTIVGGNANVIKCDENYESCYNCPLKCGSVVYKVIEGPYTGLKLPGFEANTIFAFGSRCDIDDPASLLKIFEILSKYGLDNDAAGVVISWAIQCFQKGILSLEDTGGVELTWGNPDLVIDLLNKITYQEGFGSLLAQGVREASETIGRGSEYYAIHCKGQDNVDALRAAKGWAFGNVVSLRGGRHLDGAPTTEFQTVSPELGEKLYGVPTAGDQTAYEGKGKLTFWYSCFKAIVDSLGLCYYTTYWGDHSLLGPEDFAQMLSAAVGEEFSAQSLLHIGQRIVNVEKAFNTIHEGFSRQDDLPPKIFTCEKVKTGKYKGHNLDMRQWNSMLDEFYSRHEWDIQTGWQTRACLENLELYDVIQLLESTGRIPQ